MPNSKNQPVLITSLVLSKIRFLVLMTLVVALVIIAASFLLPKMFRAESKIVPSSRFQSSGSMNIPGSLRNASSLMGYSLGGGDNDLSQLFSHIVRDHIYTQKVLNHEFMDQNGQIRTLALHLDPEGDGSVQSNLNLAKMFNRRILKIGIDERTGITTLAVEMLDPQLTRDVANFCVQELDRTHRAILNEQSEQLVSFLDERLDSTAEKLLDAELAIEDFYQKNRIIQGNSHLEFAEGRLLRNIQLKNELFLSLAGQLELAQIEQFKKMPTIVVLDSAVVPGKPFKPNRPLVVFVAIVFAFFLSFSVVLFQIGKERYSEYIQANHD